MLLGVSIGFLWVFKWFSKWFGWVFECFFSQTGTLLEIHSKPFVVLF